MTKNERTLYVFALRYALTRHTYALSLVADEILAHKRDFETWELEQMITECRQHYPGPEFGGDSIDQPTCDRLMAELRAEVERRGVKHDSKRANN